MSTQRRRRVLWAVALVVAAGGVFAATALAASLDLVELSSSPEAVADTPQSIAAADLDGDGDQDGATANFNSDNVTILKNTGAGDFREAASSPEAAGDGPDSIVAADLDGDGDQDLAIANENVPNVTILRNNGRGNFRERSSSPEPAGAVPAQIVAADLDGDGDQDLAVADFA